MNKQDYLSHLIFDLSELCVIIIGYNQQSKQPIKTFSHSKRKQVKQNRGLLSRMRENVVTHIVSKNVSILFNCEKLTALIHAVKTYQQFVVTTIPHSADREEVLGWLHYLV